MRKVQTINFKEFVNGQYKQKQNRNKALYMTIITATGAYLTIGLPKGALAATEASSGAFDRLYEAAMRLFDGAVVVMIVICGAMWGFGHRSQAIERLIGVGAGYILARHAHDIKDFFKSI
ncbi:glycosyltransferase [Metabacillus sp. B2-18]|uniref:glycosyltransferase n=1 Tax=Metabacillus sp. B2-18 TaxID=2897333 RepID=UPI001E2CEE8F|nr:glycosyltransferase [Metabacillus sp. B2-18]UGB31725.1 glycosyltransferase [Metabacillus sp. B2-18]